MAAGVLETKPKKFYLYTPYEVKKVRVHTRKVAAVRPIEHLVINLGGPFEEIGGGNEAIGGDVTKMGQ